jgi:hypothetical protein
VNNPTTGTYLEPPQDPISQSVDEFLTDTLMLGGVLFAVVILASMVAGWVAG